MKLRVGIVGCGMIAGGPVREGRPIVGNHAAACRAAEDVEIVAASEPDAERRAAFGRYWDVSRTFSTAEAMLDEVPLDLLIVATPPEVHESVCLAAIDRGVKGILCEKPFTGAAASAQRIVNAARAKKTALVANFTRRWDTSHRDLAKRIAAGDIGEVREVFASYTGTVRGNGAHFVDTLHMLAPGNWAASWTSRLPIGERDGPIDAVLERGDGARAHVAAIRGAEYFVFEIQLYGTKGRARLLFQGNDIRLDGPRPHTDFPGYMYLEELTAFPEMTLSTALQAAVEALADAVRGRRALDVAPESYVASLALVDSIASHATSAERIR